MARRTRILAFGSAGLLVLVGALCAAVVRGGTGQILALALIGIGLVAITSLLFLEVGLSEDRARARELAAGSPKRARRLRRGQARLERSRSHRRRLK